MANIVLTCGASVAIYKACDLASKLTQARHRVRSVLTANAAKLIDPQLFAALTGEPAAVEEYGPEKRTAMDHIDLATWADALIVAPASADLIARLALGLAGDLAGTVALALPAKKPRLLCPAMNPHMFAAPPLVRHLETLRRDGWKVMEPDEGHMACGVEGKGRMCEPAAIARAVESLV